MSQDLVLTDRAAVALLDQVEAALAAVDSPDDADELWRRIQAVEEAARLARLAETTVAAFARLRLRAKRRWGELLPPVASKAEAGAKGGSSDTPSPLAPADRKQAERARKLAAVPEETFEAALADGTAEKAPSEAAILKASRAAESVRRREESRSADPVPGAPEVRIGDAREVLADVESESVALVLTDPPYGDEAEPLYEWLAEFAARVLIPGGSLIVYTGQSRLDRDMRVFGGHMRYWWCLAMQHGQSQRLPGKFVIAEWKPVLWYVKDHRRGRTLVPDMLLSPAREKEDHPWGQGAGGVGPLIEHLTDPSELIIDPFAGTATWGREAMRQGRRWIGADTAPGGSTEVTV